MKPPVNGRFFIFDLVLMWHYLNHPTLFQFDFTAQSLKMWIFMVSRLNSSIFLWRFCVVTHMHNVTLKSVGNIKDCSGIKKTVQMKIKIQFDNRIAFLTWLLEFVESCFVPLARCSQEIFGNLGNSRQFEVFIRPSRYLRNMKTSQKLEKKNLSLNIIEIAH